MQYALLFYAEPGLAESLSAEDLADAQAEYAELVEDGRFRDCARLLPPESATSVRRSGGRTLLTDGPFADTEEVLGGVCLVEAADLDEALDLAARAPLLRLGGTVEIRPVVRS